MYLTIALVLFMPNNIQPYSILEEYATMGECRTLQSSLERRHTNLTDGMYIDCVHKSALPPLDF